jgi:murein DD-endopeptidase MepM/ murein hydrolase activator NlpD
VNYNSFLKKDYKNISLSNTKDKPDYWEKPRRRVKRIHVAIIAISLTIVSSVLLSIPDQAVATRGTLVTSNKTQLNNRVTVDLTLNYDDEIAYIDNPEINKAPLLINIEDLQTKPAATILTKPEKFTTNNSVPQNQLLPSESKWITKKVKRGESLSLIFKKSKLHPRELHDIISLGKSTKVLKSIQPGQKIKFRIAIDGSLQELVYIQDSLHSLQVKKLDSGFQAFPVIKTIDKRITHSKVIIHNSLFEAGLAAGLSNTLIMDLAGIFGWDIDFALDIRSGDQFSIVYEEHYLEGNKIRDGAILAAEFINQKRRYQAIRFTDKQNRTDYYTPEGLSMRKAFLRTPVDFRRISSRFGKRKHPILNYMRLHKGVDYVARRGTPVRASGDGKIVHKRRKGGYGRAIIIKHGGKYSTLYAHLQSYKKGLTVGKKVKQGQTIGFVGSSGRSTGPHLHYEFRVNGVHRNPLTVKLPNAKPINKEFKTEYLSYASKMMAQLESYNNISVALNP